MRRVYATHTLDGKERVVRVLSPNCRFKSQEIFDYLEEMLKVLGAADQNKYQTAEAVLSYVKEWVEQDISMTKSSALLDQEFKAANDGFGKDEGRYTIYVPQTFGEPNDHWQMEEKIDGENLTQWDELLQAGHNLNEVVSLLVKNYFFQLMHGIVHSDVSIGNVRVTQDNKVVWLDRNFLIKLSDKENSLILSLLVGDNEARKKTLLGYFNDDPGIAQLAEELFQPGGDPAQKIQQAMINLFGLGVKLPLSVVLVLKNLLVLDKLAKKAGFSGVVDAFQFNSPVPQ